MIEDVSRKSQSVFQAIASEQETKEVFEQALSKSAAFSIKPESKIVSEKPRMTRLKLYNFSSTTFKFSYVDGPLILAGTRVTVMFEVNAMKYFALGTVQGSDDQYFTIAIGRLHKLQRRNTFRVTLPPAQITANFRISRLDNVTVDRLVRIIDLSVGGMGLDIPDELALPLRASSHITGTIIVGNHSPVVSEAQVRYKRQVRISATKVMNQIGCQFFRIQPGAADKIAYLVNDCHRQLFLRTQK